MGRSESSTSVLKVVYGKAVTIDCSRARQALNSATKIVTFYDIGGEFETETKISSLFSESQIQDLLIIRLVFYLCFQLQQAPRIFFIKKLIDRRLALFPFIREQSIKKCKEIQAGYTVHLGPREA